MKDCKRNAINKFFSIKLKKWKIYFGPLVLAALKGRIEALLGDNGHKMQTCFKTLLSKNAATW